MHCKENSEVGMATRQRRRMVGRKSREQKLSPYLKKPGTHKSGQVQCPALSKIPKSSAVFPKPSSPGKSNVLYCRQIYFHIYMRNFFLCHNPLKRMPAGWGTYIYHADRPQIFAAVIEFDSTQRLAELNLQGYNLLFSYTRGDGRQRIFALICVQGAVQDVAKMRALLRDAAGWYCTCLSQQDIARYDKGSWAVLHPYNASEAPGLTVLCIKASQQYVISIQKSLFSVTGETELFESIDSLYKKEDGSLVETGDINYA